MDTVCTVEEGKLQGLVETDIQGMTFLSFMGIPYAKPPIGKLRFKAPEASEKWEGIRDATKQGNPCFSMQPTSTENDLIMERMGSEDCLFLNVYTRQILKNNQELKPVMVYIHGGAYVSGSSDRSTYGPEFLMTEDVVLVVINYRLGALGFLKFDDPALGATGNAALKDQVQALKWVQKNIKQFGGDPGNVTVFGGSAGAVCVHYLVLSPMAKGLFHKAIMQSGTILCSWSRCVNDAKQLAQTIGCTETSDRKILEFLQQVPVEKILDAEEHLGNWLSVSKKIRFGPTIEIKTEGSLISEEPVDIIESGTYNKIPLLFGYNTLDGLIAVWCQKFGFEADFQNLVPYFFGRSEQIEELNKKISQFYFGKEKPDLNDEDSYYKVLTDVIFLRAIHVCVTAHAKTSKEPIYFYRMSLETDLNVSKKLVPTQIKGANHGDEVSYLFRMMNVNLKTGSIEEKSVRRFVKMWANFAKSGNPIPKKDSLLNAEWNPVTNSELHFLDIGEELVPGIGPDIDRLNFWDELSKGVEISY